MSAGRHTTHQDRRTIPQHRPSTPRTQNARFFFPSERDPDLRSPGIGHRRQPLGTDPLLVEKKYFSLPYQPADTYQDCRTILRHHPHVTRPQRPCFFQPPELANRPTVSEHWTPQTTPRRRPIAGKNIFFCPIAVQSRISTIVRSPDADPARSGLKGLDFFSGLTRPGPLEPLTVRRRPIAG